MKFDVAIPCFFGKTDFATGIRRSAALGFDAVEGYDWKGLDFRAVSTALEETGVKLLSLCTSCFNLTEAACREDWLEGLRESCAAAKKLGVTRLITQSGPDTGEERARQHERIVQTLRLAEPVLEEYGVTVMLEPLNTIVDHKGTFLSSSLQAFEIVREVSSPFVRVIYDIYHQQITEGNIIANLTANIDLVAHLHAAGTPGRHELQGGECDYKNIFRAVDESGYKGYCGLEYGPLLEPEESLKEFRKLYL